MKLSGRIQVFVLLIAITCSFFVVFPVKAEPNPTVLMLDVKGNAHVPTEKILGVVSNTTMGEPINSQKVQLDLRAIMNTGYFVDVQAKTEKLFNGVKLIFEVIENPIFKEVKIEGLKKADLEKFKSFFIQKPGEVFNTVTFKENLTKAIKYCQEKQGLYIEPKIHGELGIGTDGVVKLELVELKYGKVIITGLVKTKEEVILRELSIKEGEIINSNDLREEYMQLMRLRLFDGLDIRFEKSDQPEQMDVILDVKEAQTGTFEVGVSYAETSNEFGGLLTYTESNLMGLGQSISLDLNYAESSRNVKFSFYEPWLDDKKTSFGLSLWNSESTITSTMNSWYPLEPVSDNPVFDMDLIQTGISMSFGRPLGRYTSGRIGFNFEQNRIDSFWRDNNTDHTNETPYQPTTPQDHPLEFWDNSVELGLVTNRLSYQDRNFVDGGYYLSGNYTLAGQYLGGEFDYHKITLEGKWFHSFTPNLVIGTRLQTNLLAGDYPDYDQLYLGGMYRLRGYNDRRYHNSETVELIGDKTLLSNTELRYRLPANKNLEFVLFYDIGKVWDGNDSALGQDYGAGFRYNVPFLGLLRFDYAWGGDEPGLKFSLGELF